MARRHNEEFKREAVRIALTSGLPAVSIVRGSVGSSSTFVTCSADAQRRMSAM